MKKITSKKKIFTAISLLLFLNTAYGKDWVYTVRSGDTLWGLCIEYTDHKNCWQKIGPYNKVKYPKALAPGTRINFPTEWLKNAPAKAEIIFIQGKVFVLKNQTSQSVGTSGFGIINTTSATEQTNKKRIAKVGDKLDINTHIETLDNSSATLKFADESILSLEENSTLKLDVLSRYKSSGMVDTRVNLRYGAAKTKVPKRTPASHFSVSTPSAIAAVRGTNFRVMSTDGDTPFTLSEVYEGAVGIGTPNKLNVARTEILVNQGFGLRADKGKTLSIPLPLSPAPKFKKTPEVQTFPIAINWNSQDKVEKYRVDILNDNKRDMLIRSLFTQDTFTEIANLNTGCYRIRVSAYDTNNLQGYAKEKRICATPALQIPTLNNKIKKDKNTLLVSWSLVEGAKSYRLEASHSKNFNAILLSQETSNTSLHIPLPANKKIYFRVMAIGEYNTVNTASNTAYWQPSNSVWWVLGSIGTILLIIAL